TQLQYTPPAPSGPPGPRQVPVSTLTLHPLAGVVPEASPDEFRALVEDVRREGIREPLRVLGNTVVDGRHRLRAALQLGLATVPVVDAVLAADETPEAYMLRTALHRRNLSDDQRAIMAARAAGTLPVTAGRRRDAAGVRFGVSASKVRDALELQRLAPGETDRVLAGEVKLAKALVAAKRARQLAQVAATPPPTGQYRTIVVDPPWEYADEGIAGAAARQYATMSDDAVKALGVASLAAPDGCHLYLWTTAPKLEVAFQVLRAWGFAFKTMLVWRKNRLGLGRYFRSQTEFVLFATRERSLPLREQGMSNLFEAPVARHSEKPGEFYALVERASLGPRLDMFARKARAGWMVWGAEAPAEAPAGGRPPAIHETGDVIKPADEGGK
ncbi:MAG: ParB N-terminal domain-containing protein, partial [Deltaproteobacteria bacterium]|nr:ParB N-terminal domain-containing protein [Deltaproteobacteria bacterium]